MTSEQLSSSEFLTPEQGRINELYEAVKASEAAFTALNIPEKTKIKPKTEVVEIAQQEKSVLDIESIRLEIDKNYQDFPYAT